MWEYKSEYYNGEFIKEFGYSRLGITTPLVDSKFARALNNDDLKVIGVVTCEGDVFWTCDPNVEGHKNLVDATNKPEVVRFESVTVGMDRKLDNFPMLWVGAETIPLLSWVSKLLTSTGLIGERTLILDLCMNSFISNPIITNRIFLGSVDKLRNDTVLLR